MRTPTTTIASLRHATLELRPQGLTLANHHLPSLSPDVQFAKRPSVAPEHEPLLAVASSYAALTLRVPSAMRRAARAYPFILLSGWLWDDTVDHNKDDPGLQSEIENALSAFSKLLGVNAQKHPTAPGTRLSQTNLDALHLLDEAVQIADAELPPYSRRLRDALWTFLESFAEKARLHPASSHSLNEYVDVRGRCVGMLPCFELAYAIKATAKGLPPSDVLSFTEQNDVATGAKLATLHCAAVNDLFSLYKDREVESTVNFPSLLAPGDSVDDYWQGALATLEYVRRLSTELLQSVESLSGAAPLREIVGETWLEMMEGNVLFHLTVPRYAEGVRIVKQLTDPSLGTEESRAAFRTSFPPDPLGSSRGAVA